MVPRVQTYAAVQRIRRWQIRGALSIGGCQVILQKVLLDHSGQCVRRVSRSLHVLDLYCKL